MFKQKGLSLIELMIAMALGLILIFGVMQIFLSSKQTYSVVVSQSQTQENARVVKHFLGRGLRHAGYWDDSLVPFNLPSAGDFVNNQIVFATDNDTSDAGVVDGTDTSMVRFNGAADGQLKGCTGMTPNENQMIVDRYYVAPAGANEQVSGLRCDSELQDMTGTSVSTDSQPLIIGVENLQIEFGIGTADRITQYVGADEVINWVAVRSVRYALLATSNQNSAGQEDTNTYKLIDGESATASGDKRLRQVQRETVFLRNFRG